METKTIFEEKNSKKISGKTKITFHEKIAKLRYPAVIRNPEFGIFSALDPFHLIMDFYPDPRIRFVEIRSGSDLNRESPL